MVGSEKYIYLIQDEGEKLSSMLSHGGHETELKGQDGEIPVISFPQHAVLLPTELSE